MSTFELAFIGLVIAAMSLFLIALGWGSWRTRGPSKPAAPAEPVVTPATRPSESAIKRRAA